nr:immunoglobulin light chain junction region [Macaca mulatta]MPO06577.1 immunoglobulin light chain junction region [Macaca mulatta]MPO07538.1 immunoglobulin light chain junction region [Macaca mulatta]MPO08106.1 immunoglobulin light chain junction region [Macaca mulatta]MPO10090.1 immunoglobulin light chain junction region [Macaca mulatta]
CSVWDSGLSTHLF